MAVPYNFQFTYKFKLTDTDWRIDPANPNTADDGQGGKKSVFAPITCPEPTCVSEPAPGPCPENTRTCKFKFVFPYNGESTVSVSGTFNDWSTVGLPMAKVGTQWIATAPDLQWGSDIEYKFIINGTNWVTDPHNDKYADDGFGGNNSLIQELTCEWWKCGEGAPGTFNWRDAIMYFAFTDRFNNGNKANDGPISSVETAANYQGGDFAGITAKINDGYFTDLGINAIWISPPMDNTESRGKGQGSDSHWYSAYHGYWPKDMEKTEEHFGTMTELKALVDAAHAKEIKILLDYPMNHLHVDAPIYAQHKNWFNEPCQVCEGSIWDDPNLSKTCWFTDYLPDLNFNNTDARNWSVNNAIWWIEQTGIDGYRLDAVKHIEIQWLKDLRLRIKNEIESVSGETFYLVGETYTGNRDTLKAFIGDNMLHGQFEFALRATIVSTVLMRQGGMQDLDNDLNTYEDKFSGAIMSPFVGNHDLQRAIHYAQTTSGSAWNSMDGWAGLPGLPSDSAPFERLANAYTVIYTIRGVPLMYYGDEIGMPGGGDPDNRRFMQWTGTTDNQNKLREHVKKLGKIRTENPALRRGTRTKVHVTQDIYAYKMSYNGKDVYVVLNRSDSQQTAMNLPSGTLTNLLTGATVGGGSVNVPARTSMILVP
ncbi:MAG: alpha-amylase family glycosyl hydrolase [Polyangiaceae bacterium]|nr:alpha-amylase family glycosyl hydrolase [Polyangiaceae bacterium]